MKYFLYLLMNNQFKSTLPTNMLISQPKILDKYENSLEIRDIIAYDDNPPDNNETEEKYDSIFLKYPLNSEQLVYLRFKQIHMNSPFSTIVEKHYAGQIIGLKVKDRKKRKL